MHAVFSPSSPTAANICSEHHPRYQTSYGVQVIDLDTLEVDDLVIVREHGWVTHAGQCPRQCGWCCWSGLVDFDCSSAYLISTLRIQFSILLFFEWLPNLKSYSTESEKDTLPLNPVLMVAFRRLSLCSSKTLWLVGKTLARQYVFRCLADLVFVLITHRYQPSLGAWEIMISS